LDEVSQKCARQLVRKPDNPSSIVPMLTPWHGSVVEVEASALARLTPSLLGFPAGPSGCVFGTFVALLRVAHAEVAA
jgi:hypothetical protein